MRRVIYALLAVTFALSLGLDGCGDSVSRERKRLVKQFMACLPDSLTDDHRQEIRGLLEVFWARVDMGEVYPEDVELIESKLHQYCDAGRIDGKDLVYFMAEVGYYSYRKDPRYNLPERIVDHPTLNPDAAIIVFGADSTGPRMQLYYRVPDSLTDSTKTPSGEGAKKSQVEKAR